MKTICLGLIAGLAIGASTPAAGQDVTAVTGATIIGAGGAPIADGVVVIEGTRIARVGPAATTAVPGNAVVIDARGKFVMPGLADMHNHVRTGSFRLQQNMALNLAVLLSSGVTMVFNPSLSLTELTALRTATTPETAPVPRVLATGPMVTVKGDVLGAPGGPTADTPDAARAAVTALKAAGVDAIKVSHDDASWASTLKVPVMKADVLAALVGAAHQEGLKVFAHAVLLEHAKEALRAGVDGLLHGVLDRPVDKEFLDLMLRNKATYVPTLSLYEDVADVAAWARRQSEYDERRLMSPIAADFMGAGAQRFRSMFGNSAFTKERLATQRANVKAVFDANVPVAMGTDTGFFGVLAGVSSHLELALMVEAGLTPDAVLRAATINAARMMGRDKELGSIEAGKAADLLVLDANPLIDVGNVRRIHRVIKAGVVHDPAELAKNVRFTFSPAPPRK